MESRRLLLALIVELVLATWTLPSPANADANSCVCPLTFVSPPTVSQQGSTVVVQVVLQNSYNLTIPTVGYLITHDSAGQPVSYSTASATMPPSSNLTLTFLLVNLLPGSYSGSIFAQSTDGKFTTLTVTATISVVGSSLTVWGTNILVRTGPPVSCVICLQRGYFTTYRNNLDMPVTGIVYQVVRNLSGQMVDYSTSTINIPPGQTGTVYDIYFGLPSGTYNATIFATSVSGTAISTSTSVVFTLTLP